MARKKREKSPMGIYHVMLRGINKQEIFFNEDDVVRMMRTLRDVQVKRDPITQVVVADHCTIYAYCILHNHLHLLLKEGELGLSDVVKRIEDSYAVYYNLKYTRVGHLFQGRFASEAVKDELYFKTVFRYIALNPVKAMEANSAEEYPFSSWNEYVGSKSNIFPVLKADVVEDILKRYSKSGLKRWVQTSNSDRCLDMDDFANPLSDAEAIEVIEDLTGCDNIEDFRQRDAQTQIFYLLQAVENTQMSLRQASRVGTITFSQLQRAWAKRDGGIKRVFFSQGESVEVPPPAEAGSPYKGAPPGGINDVYERVRQIDGVMERSRGQLFKIVDFLFDHPASTCSEVAGFMGMEQENARRKLVLLVNENIVCTDGKGRGRRYSLNRI